ncbi:NAD(P)/FAD-dependent oxidoreductase [Deinococcus roseus]|uniref:Oxidoreductase n=1 Tax=Deinococcus roseus TaxID=392414 RepID=A0ABQ2CX71_9DEIO|nr:FAD/NAD(P)-binding oxidoreductase [Deinococcus roseus]GGJ29699.1 oxidoreductase [Deinococcus roseus]
MHAEVLVVGAGPAGLAAARAASKNAKVTLLDDNAKMGGQIWRNRPDLKLPANVQWLPSSGIAGVLDEKTLLLEGKALSFDQVILCTGARELHLPFPGWTLPGVLGAGGLQAMIKNGLDVAGKTIVVAGSGPLLLAVAALARQKGAKVLKILEQAPTWQLLPFLRALSAGKILQAAQMGPQTLLGYNPDAYLLQASGEGQLQQVICQIQGKTVQLECDLLAVGFGLVPNLELAVQLGCRLDQGFIQVDDTCKTSQKGIYAAGEITGIGGLDRALLQGEISGLAATNQTIKNLVPRLRASQRFVRTLKNSFTLRPEVLKLAQPDTIVCRCEDVRLSQAQQHDNWRSAKLHTRLGMGACQGRTCAPICQILLGLDSPQTRPPIFATPLKNLLLEEEP